MQNLGNKDPGGDVDYAIHGVGYSRQRQTDPRIATLVHRALGSSRTVLNVGAGTGSYEPEDRFVIAVEPSETMRLQRPLNRPAVRGFAEELPFGNQSFDATMAMLTVHQWSDTKQGIDELKRVTRGPVVILTFDGEALDNFWLAEYTPELMKAEAPRYPKIDHLKELLGGESTSSVVPIPFDCTDGFMEAFYGRPERLLDPDVRRSQSSWSFISAEAQNHFVKSLRTDLESGRWDEKFGYLRSQPSYDGSLRLVVSEHR